MRSPSWVAACLSLSVGLLNSRLATGTKSYCPLPWNANASLPHGIDLSAPCPYGYSVKYLDVTVPKDMEMYSLEAICVFWGIVPFLVIGLMIVATLFNACVHRSGRPAGLGTREMSFLLFVAVMVGVNELILKRLYSMPRPEEFCNHTCGFPSGHSVMSIGFFTLIFLDSSWRTYPRIPTMPEEARQHRRAIKQAREDGGVLDRNGCCGWTWREWILADCRNLTMMPLSNANSLDRMDFAATILLWGILLLPVPFSRVVLKDHTPLQVTVGSAIGFVEAILFFAWIRHHFQKKLNHRLGDRVGHVFVHDYPLPVSDAVSKAQCLLVEADEESPSEDLLQALQDVHSELCWYIKGESPENLWFNYEKSKARHQRHCLRVLRAEVEKVLEGVDPHLTADLKVSSSSESGSDM
eukprot:TRINITY_DN79190_c0_g1_i1.p1 TRINITY_DN79190_c0_g1~~TRINITY_DN79190_c0_g1_i1.p1  ORF type:complete len:410 (-),score=34.80 TRINITY_DN79190_c0_g1_i1:8-1237(-)